jgi:hypothetical protein
MLGLPAYGPSPTGMKPIARHEGQETERRKSLKHQKRIEESHAVMLQRTIKQNMQSQRNGGGGGHHNSPSLQRWLDTPIHEEPLSSLNSTIQGSLGTNMLLIHLGKITDLFPDQTGILGSFPSAGYAKPGQHGRPGSCPEQSILTKAEGGSSAINNCFQVSQEEVLAGLATSQINGCAPSDTDERSPIDNSSVSIPSLSALLDDDSTSKLMGNDEESQESTHHDLFLSPAELADMSLSAEIDLNAIGRFPLDASSCLSIGDMAVMETWSVSSAVILQKNNDFHNRKFRPSLIEILVVKPHVSTELQMRRLNATPQGVDESLADILHNWSNAQRNPRNTHTRAQSLVSSKASAISMCQQYLKPQLYLTGLGKNVLAVFARATPPLLFITAVARAIRRPLHRSLNVDVEKIFSYRTGVPSWVPNWQDVSQMTLSMPVSQKAFVGTGSPPFPVNLSATPRGSPLLNLVPQREGAFCLQESAKTNGNGTAPYPEQRDTSSTGTGGSENRRSPSEGARQEHGSGDAEGGHHGGDQAPAGGRGDERRDGRGGGRGGGGRPPCRPPGTPKKPRKRRPIVKVIRCPICAAGEGGIIEGVCQRVVYESVQRLRDVGRVHKFWFHC